MLDYVLHGYVNAMECEHGHIAQRLRRLEQSLDAIGLHGQDTAAGRSVVEQLVELNRCLTAHFKREEEGGFLEDAMTTAPRFTKDAHKLLEEHRTLLQRVNVLVGMAREGDGGSDWPSFAAATRTFMRQLQSHEERENELLRRAFNVTQTYSRHNATAAKGPL